jgi:gamma-glutamyltranspeptidase / glutathione hydrolase
MTAVSAQAAVAAGNHDTVAAAVAVLRAGGNAFDAALAAGFAAAAAEPGLSSLGGGGFLLAQRTDGHQELHDFFVDVPGRGRSEQARAPHFTPVTVAFAGAEQVFHAGYGSVGVPGCLDGYLRAHTRLGRLPLAEVVAPAIRLARTGVHLAQTQADVLALLTGIWNLTPEGRAAFLPDGRPPRTGDLLRQPDYAVTLERIADGQITGFSGSALGDALVVAMAEHDGLVGAPDLSAYEPVIREPLRIDYRGTALATNPPPSFGGRIVTRVLTTFGSGDALHDPDDLARLVDAVGRATAAEKEQREAAWTDAQPRSSQGTTHVSVIDADGNVASMTTSNGSCSGVFIPGTGVHLNNVMGEKDLHPAGFHAATPGTRVASMMAPTILNEPDGSVVALGSGGSERIRSALLQVIVNLVDRGMPVGDAVAAPRVHLDADVVQIEPGFADATYAALRKGYPVNVWPASDLYFGGTHVVRRDADGVISAAGDPRRGGASAVIDL